MNLTQYPDRESWLNARKGGIGASIIARILTEPAPHDVIAAAVSK